MNCISTVVRYNQVSWPFVKAGFTLVRFDLIFGILTAIDTSPFLTTHTYYLEFYYNKTQAIPSSSHWSIFIYTTAATSAICYHVIYHQTSYDAIWSNDFRTEGAAPLQKQLWPANEKKTAALSCCTGSNNQVFKYLWSQSNWNSWKSFGCKETLIESRKALNQL